MLSAKAPEISCSVICACPARLGHADARYSSWVASGQPGKLTADTGLDFPSAGRNGLGRQRPCLPPITIPNRPTRFLGFGERTLNASHKAVEGAIA